MNKKLYHFPNVAKYRFQLTEHSKYPVLKTMDILNAQLIESGIWQHWENDKISYSYDSLDKYKESGENSMESGVLNSQTIFQFWKVLLTGYVMALIAFVGEVLMHRLKK